MSRIRTCL
jgi:hypothetical protein